MSDKPKLRILNIMLAGGAGGLEHACADYHDALTMEGHQVLSVTHPRAWVNDQIQNAVHIRARNRWDFLALARFANLCRKWKPDAIIAHGNRAIDLVRASPAETPAFGVYHNTWIKRTDHLAGAITITQQYQQALVDHGFEADRVKMIPNMIRQGKPRTRTIFDGQPIVGSMGRFSREKGFDLMLMALVTLKHNDIPFTGIIHGAAKNGSLTQMTTMRDALDLTDEVALPGWTKTPREFLRQIDIYVVPSRREGLSIAFLEAMEAGCAIVSADIPGLTGAAADGIEALFFPTNNQQAMSETIAGLLADPDRAEALGKAARARVLADYEISAVAPRLSEAILSLVNK